MAGLHLRGHEEPRTAHDFGGAARSLTALSPCRIVNAGVGAVRHQLMIGRMKLNLIAAIAARVEQFQLGRVLVGKAAALRHCGRAPVSAEFRQLVDRVAATICSDRIDQRLIERE